MNKSILQRCALLLVMLMATMAASADRIYFNPDVIKIDPYTYNPEDVIEIAIALENSQPIYGFQLSLNRAWQCTFADCRLSSRADDSYQLVSSVNNNGTFTVGAFSTNNTPLAGTDGDLLHIKLKISSGPYGRSSIGISSALLVTTGDEEFSPTIGSSLKIRSAIPISWIGFTTEEISIPVGTTSPSPLSYSYQPGNATETAVTWSSSDTSVATVDNKGYISGIAPGEAIITVTAESGVTAECRVTVCPIEISWIGVTPEEISIPVGMIPPYRLSYYYQPSDASATSVTWSSSDTSIATVTEEGYVLGIAPGEAIITVTAESGVTAECRVTVCPIEISWIGVTPEEISIPVGMIPPYRLSYYYQPSDASATSVTWSSSDTSIATVTEEGYVLGIAPGEAIITVTAESGVTAECRVTVLPIEVTSLTLNRTTAELKARETLQLTATVEPEDATDKTVRWASSNEAVATVDADGKVTAIAVGEATITATSGSVRAECRISVVATPVETAYINNGNSTMTVGTSMELTVTILPVDASDKSVVWSSSDAVVARVDENGRVEALSVGEANISALFSNGETSTITVTVIAPPAESIELSETSFEGDVDATLQLAATICPAEAAEQELAWASSNTAVATVDNTGLVTIVGYGEAEISVSTTDGSNLIAVCIVKGQPISSIDAVFVNDTVSADVYTVGGLLVKTCATKADFKRLSPGVYIVNGKKVVNF